MFLADFCILHFEKEISFHNYIEGYIKLKRIIQFIIQLRPLFLKNYRRIHNCQTIHQCFTMRVTTDPIGQIAGTRTQEHCANWGFPLGDAAILPIHQDWVLCQLSQYFNESNDLALLPLPTMVNIS